VRNLPDGRVEVLAVGGPQTLREFKAELESGPRSASVEEVVEHEETVSTWLNDFEVCF
jgi:acylphosphatase